MNKFDVNALSVNELSVSEMMEVSGGGVISTVVRALGKVYDELGDLYYATAELINSLGV